MDGMAVWTALPGTTTEVDGVAVWTTTEVDGMAVWTTSSEVGGMAVWTTPEVGGMAVWTALPFSSTSPPTVTTRP